MEFLIYIAGAVAVISFVEWFYSFYETRSARKRLGLLKRQELPDAVIINKLYSLLQTIAPYFGRLRIDWLRREIKKCFISAGIDGMITEDEYLSFHLVMIVGSSVFAILFGAGLFLWLAIAIFIGIVFPLQWLRGLIKKRRDEISRSLPNILDILTLSVEAGLDLMSAIARIVESFKGDQFVRELSRLLDDVKIGVTNGSALRNLAKRCDIPSVTSFTALLIQADRLGSPIGAVLRAQSEKTRSDRFQRAERMGTVAAQKLLFPLIFFIIPSVFIVIFGPLFIRFISGELI